MLATLAHVVARSPDLATLPTEGLQSEDLQSRSRRGETPPNVFGGVGRPARTCLRWKRNEFRPTESAS